MRNLSKALLAGVFSLAAASRPAAVSAGVQLDSDIGVGVPSALRSDRPALAGWLGRDTGGYGAFVAGHKMLHCLFVTPRSASGKAPMTELAEQLVRCGHASELLLRFGPAVELSLDPWGQPVGLSVFGHPGAD